MLLKNIGLACTYFYENQYTEYEQKANITFKTIL